jgi:protein-S-isoprenylcysteine O-methyltransferase Ste14
MEEPVMEDQEVYRKARKRAEAKIGFYIHLAVYLAVSVLLIVINLSTSSDVLWFKWPIIGWGIGVLFHGLGIFAFSEGSAFKERLIENEMKRMDRNDRPSD